MKYRHRTSEVEAIQVKFRTAAWPGWLEGKIGLVGDKDFTDGPAFKDGDYIVLDGNKDITVYSAEEFHEAFERAYKPRVKDATGGEDKPRVKDATGGEEE